MTGMLSPPSPPKRWLPHTKAKVVAAVRDGLLSLDEAYERYTLSFEEYLTWQRRVKLFGLAGLRVDRKQQRRRVRTLSAK